MAKKKTPLLQDLENLDYMDIISGGVAEGIFSTNSLIDYSYSTGIPIIDYAFGYEINIRDENDKVIGKRNCLGIQAGSFNVVTGRTQSYKTTATIQMISYIAYHNNGNIIHYDCEGRLVLERAKTLSHLPISWFTGTIPRYSLRKGAIGYDTLKNDITEIYKRKISNKDILLKDMGVVDASNKPIKLMPPTIMFVDSLQNIISDEKSYNVDNKDFDDTYELRNNMTGAQNAKTIRGLLTDVVPMLIEANIILIVIAHKTANMSANPALAVGKQFQYGQANERMSGGSAVEFNASAVINLTGLSKEDSRFYKEQDGFDGNTILFEPTKSSTNESGNLKTGMGFYLIIDKTSRGVDNIRSLCEFLKQRNRLKGNRAGYKVIDKEGNELTEKFTWKHIYEDFENNREMYVTFMKVAKEELETLISKSPDNNNSIEEFDMDKIVNNTDVTYHRIKFVRFPHVA